MVRFTWRRYVIPLAVFVFVMIAAAAVWNTVEVSPSAATSHALHMQDGGQESPDTARRHHAHLHDGGAPDCMGVGAACPMMSLCYPAMLVDLSLLAVAVHHDDAVAIAVGRGIGINPSIILPPPRPLHL